MLPALDSGIFLIALGYALGALTMVFLTVYTIRQRESSATLLSFAALTASIALWSGAGVGRLLFDPLGPKLTSHYIGYVGIVFAPVAWIHFAALYTGKGRYVSRRTVTGLSILSLGILTLAVTNVRNLFYRSIDVVSIGDASLLALDAGPAFWPVVTYNYLLVLVGIVSLVLFAVTSDTLYRLQSALIVAAAVFPFLLNGLYLSGFSFGLGVDLTPIAFSLSGLMIAVAVFYGDFVSQLPVARDAIIEQLDDAIIVVDHTDAIAHANPAARSLLTGDDGTLVGEDVAAVLPWDLERADSSEEVSIEADGGRRWYWYRQIELDTQQVAAGDIYMITDITERKQLEQRLRALQKTHQRLMTAETIDEAGEIVVDAAREVLDLPITGLWRFDADSSTLVPVTSTAEATALVGAVPTYAPGNSLGWETFQRGDLRVISDVTDREKAYDRDSPITAEIQIPVGEHGLIVTGSPEDREFDEVTLELVRILAAATERAFIKTERERELRDQERQLTRENERLEEFTSVVAHDLRSPLNSTDILLDRLTDEYDDRRLRKVASVHHRTKELVNDLLALARQGKAVEDPQPTDAGAIAERAWESIVTEEATLDVRLNHSTVLADESRLRQAFENLFRNAVEHGGEAVAVRVDSLDGDEGFYVADDGPGIPDAERSQVFDHGYTRSDDGAGFGLAIVRRIAAAHGWTVRAAQSSTGGFRVEIALTTSDGSDG